MNEKELLENARGHMGPHCKACPVCNGRACTNQIPGPGAKGVGDVAIRNYDAWQKIRLNMNTIAQGGEPDTSFTFFGHKMALPIFAGPVGAVNLHYGDQLDDIAYNDILVRACSDNGILAFTGDGTNPKVMEAACAAIRKAGGLGVPTVKPWDIDTLKEKFRLVHESTCFAVAMDIDAAGLPFLKGLTPPAGSKTVPAMPSSSPITAAVSSIRFRPPRRYCPPSAMRSAERSRSLSTAVSAPVLTSSRLWLSAQTAFSSPVRLSPPSTAAQRKALPAT